MDFSQILSQNSLNIDLSLDRLKFATTRAVTGIFQKVRIVVKS